MQVTVFKKMVKTGVIMQKHPRIHKLKGRFIMHLFVNGIHSIEKTLSCQTGLLVVIYYHLHIQKTRHPGWWMVRFARGNQNSASLPESFTV